MSITAQRLSSCDLSVYPIGQGGPLRLVIPGLVNHPEDWIPLQSKLGGTLLVVKNDIHEGEKTWDHWAGHDLGWQKHWRHELEKALAEVGGDDVITHSRGSEDFMRVRHPESLRRAIFLATPTAQQLKKKMNPCPTIGQTDDLNLYRIDQSMSAMCPEMPQDVYTLFVQRQLGLYGTRFKDVIRRESPTKLMIPVQEMRALIMGVRKNIFILIIPALDDPWHDDANTDTITAGQENVMVRRLKRGGHYSHVHPSDELVTFILENQAPERFRFCDAADSQHLTQSGII